MMTAPSRARLASGQSIAEPDGATPDRGRSGVPAYLRDAPDRQLGLSPKAWSWVLVAAAAAVLEVAPRSGWVDPFSLVPLSAWVSTAISLLADGDFWGTALLPTLTAIGLAAVSSIVSGVMLGWGLWRLPFARRAVDPWMTTYYAIPTFALYPLLVAVLGVGMLPIVLLATLFAVVAVAVNTLAGFDAVPPTAERLSRSLLLTRRQHFRMVLFPSALPGIIVGVRLALSYSIISVLASEFILASRGLGRYIAVAYNNFAVAEMYAGVLLVLGIAVSANAAVSLLIRRITWLDRA
jgi:NitT/TauT family transport system permease protein